MTNQKLPSENVRAAWREQTEAEYQLWRQLRERRFFGLKFHREHQRFLVPGPHWAMPASLSPAR